MPTKLLSSLILKWPSKEEVEKALKKWATKIKQNCPEIKKIGYFGSYSKGNWGVGSDIDIIIVVKKSEEPFILRPLKFDTTELPVPANVLVYTEQELNSLKENKFKKEVLKKEVVWL